MNPHLALKNRLKEYRKTAGISQSRLAKEMNVSRNTITAIETGRFSPSAYIAYLLCDYFGCNFLDLFYMEKDDDNEKQEDK